MANRPKTLRRLSLCWALTSGVLLLGCRNEPAGLSDIPADGALLVDLQTDQTRYPVGGSAQITMTNRSTQSVMIGVCDAVLERLVGGRWTAIPPLGYPCPDIGLFIEPGASRTLPFDLRPATKVGVYRVRRAFWPVDANPDSRSLRRSNSFILQ